MRSRTLFGLIALLLCLLGVGSAQTPTPPATVPKDELVDALLLAARLQAQLANTACQQQVEVQNWNKMRDATLKKIETRLPGYTVDWSRFVVIAKAPTPPAVK